MTFSSSFVFKSIDLLFYFTYTNSLSRSIIVPLRNNSINKITHAVDILLLRGSLHSQINSFVTKLGLIEINDGRQDNMI